jgi:hypothetical protein
MHPVHPPVHVVGARQVPLRPLVVLGLPGLGEALHGGGGQVGRRAEELAQGGSEVPRRQAAQVKHRQDLGHLGRLSHVGRQDDRAVMLAFPAVIDPGGFDLGQAGTGRYLPFLGIAIADDEALARLVDQVGVGVQVGPALGEERHLEHFLGGQAAQLVQADSRGCDP